MCTGPFERELPETSLLTKEGGVDELGAAETCC